MACNFTIFCHGHITEHIAASHQACQILRAVDYIVLIGISVRKPENLRHLDRFVRTHGAYIIALEGSAFDLPCKVFGFCLDSVGQSFYQLQCLSLIT